MWIRTLYLKDLGLLYINVSWEQFGHSSSLLISQAFQFERQSDTGLRTCIQNLNPSSATI